MIVQHPHARATRVIAVVAGLQGEIDPLAGADVEGVARHARAGGQRIAVEVGERRMMAVGVEMKRVAAGIEHAQLGGFVRLHHDRGVAHRERERAPVQQEDVRLALRGIVVAVHPLLDLARVPVGGGDAMQPVVDIHEDERVFTLISLARGLAERRDPAGAEDDARKVVVGPPRLDDDHAGEPHRHVHVLVHVAMIEIGARKFAG